jgi:serine/threonine protein kinase
MHLASQEWLAVKEQKISEVLSHKNGLNLIAAELRALRVIGSHPFIIGLHFAFYDITSCYLALDLCCGGDLRYHMKKHTFGEYRVAFIVMCVSSALQHLHEHGVIHRDIKPENVIFNERGYPLLTDFGVAFIHPSAGFDFDCGPRTTEPEAEIGTKRDQLQCNMSSGTKQYLAPEVFTSSHLHGPGVDYWSLGVMAYELLFGKRPFQRHCPSNLIAFAENDYVLSTEIHPAHPGTYPAQDPQPNPPLYPGILLSSSVVTVDCSEPSTPPLSPSPLSPLPSPASPASPWTSLSPQDPSSAASAACPALPHFLRTRIPRSSVLHGDISISCRSLLSQLLEVRPLHRLSYTSLTQHEWFEKMNLRWGEVERALIESPFQLDLKQVALDICTRHMFPTEDGESAGAVSRQSLTSAEAAQLKDTLTRFQYVSPEFGKYVPEEIRKKLAFLSDSSSCGSSSAKIKEAEATAADSRSGLGVAANGGSCPGSGSTKGADKVSFPGINSSPVVHFRHEIL